MGCDTFHNTSSIRPVVSHICRVRGGKKVIIKLVKKKGGAPSKCSENHLFYIKSQSNGF